MEVNRWGGKAYNEPECHGREKKRKLTIWSVWENTRGGGEETQSGNHGGKWFVSKSCIRTREGKRRITPSAAVPVSEKNPTAPAGRCG